MAKIGLARGEYLEGCMVGSEKWGKDNPLPEPGPGKGKEAKAEAPGHSAAALLL